MLKKLENNGTGEIGVVTPTPGLGVTKVCVLISLLYKILIV